jgi:hypothetical protein
MQTIKDKFHSTKTITFCNGIKIPLDNCQEMALSDKMDYGSGIITDLSLWRVGLFKDTPPTAHFSIGENNKPRNVSLA